jgi:hypothetical protein
LVGLTLKALHVPQHLLGAGSALLIITELTSTTVEHYAEPYYSTQDNSQQPHLHHSHTLPPSDEI